MPRLTQLRSELITPEVIEFLARHDVHTWEDLIITDLSELRSRSRSAREAECCDLANQFLLRKCNDEASCMDARQLFSLAVDVPFSLGSPSLDSLLGGGLMSGTVLELVGSEGSGKTQVCLQLAASAALRSQAAVLYLDTGASFSSRRLADILACLAGTRDLLETRWSDCSRAMKCIIRAGCPDIFSTITILEDLKPAPYYSTLTKDFISSLRVLILDSASSVAAPVLGGTSPQGHALMMHMGRALLQLAACFNMAVLVTNHMVLGEDGQRRPALGESWKAVPHARVLLEADEAHRTCTATLLKHQTAVCGSCTKFQILE